MTDTFDETLARRIEAQIEAQFVPHDEGLRQSLLDAEASGLPAINVSPNLGKLVYLIARIAGATRVLEIGTLGGYSTTWLARALPEGGRVVSLEIDERHAEVARRTLARCGVSSRADVRVGDARTSLQTMVDHGEGPFDLVFIDADKESYPDYLALSLELVRPGAIILADNVVRNGRLLEPEVADPADRAVKVFNELVAAHPRLESLIVPIVREDLDGLLISVVR